MIDAEIQNGQVTKRYIFINLRPVAVIEYENDTNSDTNNAENSNKNNSTSGSKYASYSQKSTAIYAIHTDHLGTPQAISDSQQAVVWRADYATFGRATVQARVVDGNTKTASSGIISTANAATAAAKPFEFNLRFAGQYEDTESGYHYNWHRYYDPSTGRYLTPDPIGLAGGLNGYGYAGQDPMGAVDPWGLYTEIIIWQPVGNGASSFGHVSSNVNGTNYSWGTKGWDTNPSADDFAKKNQKFRTGVGVILKLTPEQEKKLVQCYAKAREKYTIFGNNCADPHKDCLLEATGVPVRDSLIDSVFPVSLGNDLLDSPYFGGTVFYDKK